jgi:ubiquitin carboxyl-terminal hydrolase 36/42
MVSWEQGPAEDAQILNRRIEFRKATKYDPADLLRSKLIPLNKSENVKFLSKKMDSSSQDHQKGRQPVAKREEEEEDEEIRPRRWLYDKQKIEGFMRWTSISRVGAGLHNLGNSCFMNSVLQTLTYIPPLRNFIATITKQDSPRYQDVQGFDPLNTLKRLFDEVSSNKRVVSPDYIFRNLKRFGKTFRPGRQEDAQEFALYLLESCHDALLRSVGSKVDARTAETSAIHQIFGGYLRSQVKWDRSDELRKLKSKSRSAPSVGNTSNTFDPFLILSVEIKGDSIEKCLTHFTKAEILDANNMYKTPSGVYVPATKRFAIHRPPRVLMLHLKRFNSVCGYVRGMYEAPFQEC